MSESEGPPEPVCILGTSIYTICPSGLCVAKKNRVAVLRGAETIAFGGLAHQAAIILGSGITITQNMFLTALEAICVVTGLTGSEGEGLCIGIANADLSVTEIAECLLADGPVDLNDKVKAERASRMVKLFGVGVDSAGTDITMIGEGGSPVMKTNPKWLYTAASNGWNMFIWNQGVALTTGATARAQITYFGSWII